MNVRFTKGEEAAVPFEYVSVGAVFLFDYVYFLKVYDFTVSPGVVKAMDLKTNHLYNISDGAMCRVFEHELVVTE